MRYYSQYCVMRYDPVPVGTKICSLAEVEMINGMWKKNNYAQDFVLILERSIQSYTKYFNRKGRA